jgi:hypothetical protein
MIVVVVFYRENDLLNLHTNRNIDQGPYNNDSCTFFVQILLLRSVLWCSRFFYRIYSKCETKSHESGGKLRSDVNVFSNYLYLHNQS